jgi:histone-binding protein RBBP4
VLEQGAHSNKQRLYLSEQTDGSEPNRIVLVSVDVLHARTAAAEHLQGFAEHTASPHVGKPLKTLVHPGEVNRMRELPQHPHVLVTHTDSPSLYVWNTDTQPDRTGVKVSGTWTSSSRPPRRGGVRVCQPRGRRCRLVSPVMLLLRFGLPLHPTALQSTSPKQQSVADLVLEGHKQNAEFALAISNAAPLVASGGKDAKVGGGCCLERLSVSDCCLSPPACFPPPAAAPSCTHSREAADA